MRKSFGRAKDIYRERNAARSTAPTIISNPAIVATNPSEIRMPPKVVLGPHGPNPDANVSAKAAIPRPKESAPNKPKRFTAAC